MNQSFSIDSLVRGLCRRLEVLYKDFPLLRPGDPGYGGSDIKPHYDEGNGLRVYPHEKRIPNSADAERGEDDAPYIIVRATSGTLSNGADDSTCNVTVAILTWDGRTDNQGDTCVLDMIQMLHTDLGRNPHIGNFRVSGSMQWSLGDDDLSPYYLGVISIPFTIASISIEDTLA